MCRSYTPRCDHEVVILGHASRGFNSSHCQPGTIVGRNSHFLLIIRDHFNSLPVARSAAIVGLWEAGSQFNAQVKTELSKEVAVGILRLAVENLIPSIDQMSAALSVSAELTR